MNLKYVHFPTILRKAILSSILYLKLEVNRNIEHFYSLSHFFCFDIWDRCVKAPFSFLDRPRNPTTHRKKTTQSPLHCYALEMVW